MLKKFLIGTFAALALMVASTAFASYDFGPTTLKVGSTGEYVKTLQTLVGATPVDGKFGPITKAKVMAWQTNNGLVADGLFGPMSKAAANATTGGTFPAGCTSTAGYSSTTGAKCDGTTGGTVTFEGTSEGKLTSFEEDAPDASDVREGESKAVLNVSFEADNADQKITRVDVDFQAADSTQSDKPWKYMKEASLYFNGTKVATKAGDVESSYDRTDESTTYDTWSMRFSDLNLIIKDGAEARLEVYVTSLSNIDGTDEGQSWEAAIPVNGIRAVSPNGLSETYPATELNADFTFSAVSTAALTFSSSTKDPVSGIISIDDTNDTTDVLLFAYKGKATNGPVFIEDSLIEVDAIVTTGTGDQVSDFVQTFYLYADGVKVGSASGDTTADLTDRDITFSNVNLTIAEDKTVEFEIRADIQPLDGTIVVAGDKITMTLDASDVVTEYAEGSKKGDSITPTGDVTGSAMYFYVDAPNITLVNSVLTKTLACDGVCASGEKERAEAVFTFDVDATGSDSDIYIQGTLAEDADETDTTYGTGSTYFLKENGGTEPTASGTLMAAVTAPNSSYKTATEPTATRFKIAAGTKSRFTVTVVITAGADGIQNVGMSSIEWSTTNVAAGNAATKDYIYSMQPDWTTNGVYLEYTA